jgi:uncharacterized membrane protein
MTHQEASAVVAVPIDTVEERLRDVTSWPAFVTGVEAVEALGYQRYRLTVRGVNGVRQIDTAVVDHPKEHRVTWHSLEGAHFDGEYRLSAVDDGHTKVHLSLVAEPAGLLAGLSEMLGTSHSTATVNLQRLEAYLATAATA